MAYVLYDYETHIHTHTHTHTHRAGFSFVKNFIIVRERESDDWL